MQARAELRWSPKVAVLIGSYVSSPQFSLDSGIFPDISSLHIFGSNDYVIPTAKSQQVVDTFKQQQVHAAFIEIWMCLHLLACYTDGILIFLRTDGRELRGDFRARPRSCDPQMQRMQGAIRVIPNPSAAEIAQ